ncbi:beta-lactamase/transpeptidase-like protein [Melanomma pulvis-pyrius CBS 109.77]|uniref:Beta-lactamase/transpeptidase-like protein n=1 Tax=Melanomma pulvis-pyrius CBS 109.77 TaxID=1314802 RepID=A0A6A6WX49_9PLEO|nr:beta-lactamase/transpeptidase-like protein [Melanomma pulvis-pyrius CBS 109.77]
MADFEQLIETAIAENEIPGAVLQAVNRDGSFAYSKSFGKRSVREGGDRSPLTPSSIMWVASCTKLMTSICAMQLVERGVLSLDEPVYKHIPELKDFPIITGFSADGKPIETPHKNPITLRLLLCHSSGLTYDAMHPLAAAWSKYHGHDSGASGKLLERFSCPLVFEPGTAWIYGASIDYAGLLIERATKKTLEEFMKENLWEPLGIKDMTFNLGRRPDLKVRFVDMSVRDETTGKMRSTDARHPYQDGNKDEVTDCMGGQGIFTSPEEYIKVLQALLTCDENEKILKKETLELFFSPQLSEGGIAMMSMILSDPMANNAMGGVPQGVKKDWGLGGILLCGDDADGKREGTMIWGGLPNLIWFCDRKTGLCGIFSCQVLPTGDAKIAVLQREFEAAMYKQYSKSRNV